MRPGGLTAVSFGSLEMGASLLEELEDELVWAVAGAVVGALAGMLACAYALPARGSRKRDPAKHREKSVVDLRDDELDKEDTIGIRRSREV
jgi:gas vesicle protein